MNLAIKLYIVLVVLVMVAHFGRRPLERALQYGPTIEFRGQYAFDHCSDFSGEVLRQNSNHWTCAP